MHLTPDRRLYTKAWMTFATITACVLAGTGIATWIINVASDDPGSVIPILWIVVACYTAAMWLVGAPIAWLWIRNLSYEVTDDMVVVHRGIRTKVDEFIPLRMVTDFRLHRSLYDRWLNIGSIDLQTTGHAHRTSGYEGRIAGQRQPELLHNELRGRITRLEGTQAVAIGNGGGKDLHALLEEVREIHHLLEQ
jgi:uncharacterized membrane protein YdbT with pleckstrin-like domain